MNAVNQFGQQNSIGRAPVDFMYTEVWTGHEGYKDLATVIQNNADYSGGKNTVLAAYLNYKKAESPGSFNTPGVLLANAVIFAFGGSHLEMGEHMLGKEYFPNNNLAMNDDLQKAIISYYDFLTAYENLLRDGGNFNNVTVTCTNGKFGTTNWPPQSGKVAVQGKKVGEKQVLHLINLANATSFDWRDTNGTQPMPATFSNAELEVNVSGSISKVWVASPDVNHGLPQLLTFTQQGDKVKFTLPVLKYWNMLVIE
jgi:dextranase